MSTRVGYCRDDDGSWTILIDQGDICGSFMLRFALPGDTPDRDKLSECMARSMAKAAAMGFDQGMMTAHADRTAEPVSPIVLDQVEFFTFPSDEKVRRQEGRKFNREKYEPDFETRYNWLEWHAPSNQYLVPSEVAWQRKRLNAPPG